MGSFMNLNPSTLQIGCMVLEKGNALPKMSSCNLKLRAKSPQELPQVQRQLQVETHIVPAVSSLKMIETQKAPRRSGNYHPSIWGHRCITESMGSTYSGEQFLVRLEEMKLEARLLLMDNCEEEPLQQLRTIDSMQRLGVAYHFQEEIKGALDQYHKSYSCSAGSCEELALGFRLLRQHDYNISSENMLKSFEDLIRKSKDFSIQDIRSLLAVYEASHLAAHGEPDVDEAKRTTTILLSMLVPQMDDKLAKLVEHSLEMPLHWRMPRLEVRDYINLYEMDEGRNPLLLELAKFDYNIVQSMHQRELRELSRWWKGLGLAESLPFSRDRLVENHLWSVGISFEPHLSDFRLRLTKMVCILTVIDDIYDVYGSLDELELFTAAVESWSLEASESLPEYMKPCFLALYNFVEEVALDVSEIHGWDAIPFICREWKRLCQGYLVEAKWFNNGHKPTLVEYLENAWITVGGPISMVHAYLLKGSKVPYRLADCLQTDAGLNLIYVTSLITRLSDDLGTSKAEMERGDILKLISRVLHE